MDVWLVDLRGSSSGERDVSTLDAEERAHAAAFRCERDRRRYVAAHSVLRDVLATYLRTSSGQVRFLKSEKGKPRIADERAGPHDLRFNLSHSGDYALIAVARGREVGVDIQVIDPEADLAALAQLVLTPRERALVARGAQPAPRSWFWTAWARKEAALKGIGTGFSVAPDEIEVLSVPLERSTTLETASGTWLLQDLPVGLDYVACVAARGTDWSARPLAHSSAAACGRVIDAGG